LSASGLIPQDWTHEEVLAYISDWATAEEVTLAPSPPSDLNGTTLFNLMHNKPTLLCCLGLFFAPAQTVPLDSLVLQFNLLVSVKFNMRRLSPGAFPSRTFPDLLPLLSDLELTPDPDPVPAFKSWFTVGKQHVESWEDFPAFLASAEQVKSTDGAIDLLQTCLSLKASTRLQESLSGKRMGLILEHRKVVFTEVLEGCLIQEMWPTLCALIGSEPGYPIAEHITTNLLCAREANIQGGLTRMTTGDSQLYLPDKYLELRRKQGLPKRVTLPSFSQTEELDEAARALVEGTARVVVGIKLDYEHPLLPTRESTPHWFKETGDLFSYMNSEFFDPESNPVAEAVTYACVTRTRPFILFTLNRVTFGWVDFDDVQLRVKLSPTLDCTQDRIALSDGSEFSPWEVFVRFLLACEGTWYIEKVPEFIHWEHEQIVNASEKTRSKSEQYVFDEDVLYSELWDANFNAKVVECDLTFRSTIRGFDAVFKLVFFHVRRSDRAEPSWLVAESLENEANVYQVLQHLQGKCIPRLLWYGSVVSGLGRVLITEFAGEPLPVRPSPVQCELAFNALRELHRCGVLYGYVHKESFVCQGDSSVFFLDFGGSEVFSRSERTSEWEQKATAELAQLRRLFS
jgi:hypothetical protein